MVFRSISSIPAEKPLVTVLWSLGAGRVTRKAHAALQKAIRQPANIIISHHPILTVSDQWFKQIGIENQAEVVRCFKRKRTVISGHAHHYFDVTQGNIRQLVGMASAYGFEHQTDSPQRNGSMGMTIYKANWEGGEICVEHLGNHQL